MNIQRWMAFLIAILIPICLTAQQGLRDRDPSLGATKKIANDLQRSNFHSGPFYLLSSFQLSDIGYSEEFFVPTDDHQGGLTVSLEAPQRLYFVPRKKTVYSIDFVPSVAFFSGQGTSQQFGYSLRADAQYLLNHLYLDFYVLGDDRLRAFVGEINHVATQKSSEFGVAGEYKYSSKTGFLFSARRRSMEFPTDRFQPETVPVNLLAREENNYRLTFQHRTLPRTSFRFASELSEYRFKRATYKDSRREYFGVGALYDNGRIAASAEIGPARLEFDDPAQRDFSGLLGNFTATRRIGSRWSAALSGDRDVDFAIFVDNNYRVVTRGALTLEFAATRKLTLRGASSVERDVFEVPFHGQQRRDDITFNLVGWRYTLRRLRFGFDVGYYTRESTYLGGEEAGIRYIVHLSFTP